MPNKEEQHTFDFEKEGQANGAGFKIFGDYDKFIGIMVKIDTPFHFYIRPERITDKLYKLLGAEYEFQTGDKPFDRKFFIKGRENNYYQSAVSCREVRKQISELPPFTEFFVGPNCVFWKKKIRSENEFRGIPTDDIVKILFEIGTILSGIDV